MTPDLNITFPPGELDSWPTKAEAADLLRTSISTIERMISRKELETAKRPRPGKKPETVINPAQVQQLQHTPTTPAFITRPEADPLLEGIGFHPSRGTSLTASPQQSHALARADLLDSLAGFFQRMPAPQPAQPEKYLILQELSAESGLSIPYLRRAIKDGRLVAIRDGRQWKAKKSSLAKL
jgi:hypothetical protein